MNIANLDDDSFYEIILYLSFRDFVSLSLTCTKMYDLSLDTIFWKHYLQTIFHTSRFTYSKEEFKLIYEYWDWSSTFISSDIQIYPKNVIHRGITEDFNPSARIQRPFNPSIPCIKFIVIHRGEWIGLGVVDRSFQLKDAQTIGYQPQGFNCAYFSAEENTLQARMSKKIVKVNLMEIKDGDIMTIYLDYQANTISFEINNILQGIIIVKDNLQNIELYPCVNLSWDTAVQIHKDV